MKYCIAAAMLFSLASCELITLSEILIELPAAPTPWSSRSGDYGYLVKFLRADGSSGAIQVEPGGRRVLLHLPDLPVVPVSALPLCGNPPAAMKPCGAVYPAQLSAGKVLRLTWENGFLSEILLGCGRAGDSLQAVNVEKLSAELLKKSDGNPWRLDGDMLAAAIADETLAYRSLRPLPRFDVAVEASAGEWASSNPLSPGPVDCPGGTLLLHDLPVGVHTFFLIGAEERLDICVTGSGWFAVNPVRGAGSSGRW